jgi:NAD(P)-dependent dehydrogenase (short-subunit alcohol dehydrogenase family)
MSFHPALAPGRVAVITGASSGIGLAFAARCLELGLRVALADVDDAELSQAVDALRAEHGADRVFGRIVDVRSRAALECLRSEVSERWGSAGVLMNNAGTGLGGGPLERPVEWQQTLEVNLWGVVHGCQVFVPAMLESGQPGLVINTGSKQGITCPPGNTAYNVSKAGVKVYSEALEHDLRNRKGTRVSAHLLVPGWTDTAIVRKANRDRARLEGKPAELESVPSKPAGAWTSEQVVAHLLEGLKRGQFYILCPDNDVTLELDRKRMAWAMGDLIEDRPPLSRWHPDYAEAFKRTL